MRNISSAKRMLSSATPGLVSDGSKQALVLAGVSLFRPSGAQHQEPDHSAIPSEQRHDTFSFKLS